MIPAQPRLFWLTMAVMVMAIIVSKFTFNGVEQLRGGFESPVLALELARSACDAKAIADGKARRAILKKNNYADIGLIIAYMSLWFSIGKRLNRIVAIAALLAGVANVIEDVGMLMTLYAAKPSPGIVESTYFASCIKWVLLGLVFIALSFYFRPRLGLRDGWDVARAGTALAYAYSGILCLAGVFFSNPIIERAFSPTFRCSHPSVAAKSFYEC